MKKNTKKTKNKTKQTNKTKRKKPKNKKQKTVFWWRKRSTIISRSVTCYVCPEEHFLTNVGTFGDYKNPILHIISCSITLLYTIHWQVKRVSTKRRRSAGKADSKRLLVALATTVCGACPLYNTTGTLYYSVLPGPKCWPQISVSAPRYAGPRGKGRRKILTLSWRNKFSWGTFLVSTSQNLSASQFIQTTTKSVCRWYRSQRDVHLFCRF